MRSTCSIFAARVCFSLLACGLLAGSLSAEDNYSLWPKRPEAFAGVKKMIDQGKFDEAVRQLQPLIAEEGVVGKEAKAMLGELRIRQVLSPELVETQNYTVRRGDSWLRIAARTKCPIDYIIHINQLMELGPLQVGEIIKYKDLDYRVEINTLEREVSIWDGDSFIRSYPIMMMKDEGKANFPTAVKAQSSSYMGVNVNIYAPMYAAADKSILLEHGNLMIDSSADGKMRKPGFYLKKEDCNELSLLLRSGNKVDIIREKKQ